MKSYREGNPGQEVRKKERGWDGTYKGKNHENGLSWPGGIDRVGLDCACGKKRARWKFENWKIL